MLVDERNQLVFSVVSLWEIAIKRGLGRDDFHVDSRLLRRSLIDNDYEELALTGQHAVTVDGLPAIHRDPFDRLLVAQSMVEGITLLTSDVMVAQYAGTVLLV
jgi:PIN domain nuclease of toxin-antitoxin system